MPITVVASFLVEPVNSIIRRRNDNVQSASVVSGVTEPLAAGVLAAIRETQAVGERERKFRTIWDAVAWLKVHHPEIDLDAPYKPRR